MRAVLLIALHDLRMVLADRSALLWMFVMPVVFAAFFGLVIGGGTASEPADARARLTVVNHDPGPLSRLFVDQLASERLDIVELDPTAARATDDPVRTLLIPAEFSERIMAGEQVTVVLEKQPDTSAEAALVAQARIVAAISRLIGRLIELDAISAEHEPPTAEAIAGLRPETDLVQIESRFAGRSTVVPGGFAQAIPGMAVMFVLLVTLTYGAGSITSERLSGQLRRLVTAPLTPRGIVLGKILGRLVIGTVQVLVLVGVGVIAHHTLGIEIGDSPFGILVVLLVFVLAVAPLAVISGVWFRDPDRAASVGAAATMVMASLGGCWWPIEIVSRPLKVVAMLFPTGWAMRALHGVISYGLGLTEITTPLLVLLGFAVVLTAVAGRALRIG